MIKIIEKNLDELKPYENNARINDKAIDVVANSIKEFGFKNPCIIDKNNVLIAGHTRCEAARKLGITKIPCIIADDLTEEQIKAFRIADNSSAQIAEWDLEKLQSELDTIDYDMTQFGLEEQLKSIERELSTSNTEKVEVVTLADRFIIPPLSVFDTKQGYWQDRKRMWKNMGIRSEEGRDDDITFAKSCQTASVYNVKKALQEKEGRNISWEEFAKLRPDLMQPCVSIFDPVVCEIMYKWFNVENGSILDCFAGGSVRGIVANKLGYDYYGVDLRQEQIDSNIKNAQEIDIKNKPHWYCGDSLNVKNIVPNKKYDMIFSCPPYADLEVYSNDERDLSNMEYEKFADVYCKIIKNTVDLLKDDRFAVFVVGDVRDKNGVYRNFIDLTKKAFNSCGCKTYNEVILLEQIASASMRAAGTFTKSRKLVKVHQNILIFYKGDVKKIGDNYKEINIDELIEESIEE